MPSVPVKAVRKTYYFIMAADTIRNSTTEAKTFANGSIRQCRQIQFKDETFETSAEFAIWRHEPNVCEHQIVC